MSLDISKLPDLARSRAYETVPSATDIYSQAADYVGYHNAHKDRIKRLDALARNQVNTVWPDGTATQDVMKLAEFITSDIDDLSALVAGAEPTIIIPQPNDTAPEQEAATRLQHILYTYRRVNRMKRLRRETANDLIAAGLACWVMWPGYSQNPQESYPMYLRKDPRTVFPDPHMTRAQETSSVVISYTTKARILGASYPQLIPELFTTLEQRALSTEDVQIVEFYDANWCVKVAHRGARDGRFKDRNVIIDAMPNYLGKPMALIAHRVTTDGQFRGQFDTALEPLATANKMMELHLAQSADAVFSEKIVRGIFSNPEDVGPGATLYTTDYQASIDRAQPASSSQQVYQDIQLLINQSREAAGVPAARHGDISQNIASAQFVNAIQGKYITLTTTYQELVSDLEERANSLALEIDQRYMDYPDKILAGAEGGRSFVGTYTPALDIAGRFDNRVVYGAGSALDSYNRRLANINDMQYGLTSRRFTRAQLDGVDDVVAMEAEIFKEQLVDGFVAGIAAPETDLLTRSKALVMAMEGAPPEEIARAFADEMAQQQEQQAATQAIMAPPEEMAAQGQMPMLPPLAIRR